MGIVKLSIIEILLKQFLMKFNGLEQTSFKKPLTPFGRSTLVNYFANTEFQRKQAKDLTKCFRKLKRDKKIQDDKILGWTLKNAITNGRWVMIGLAIGFLTEYATGVNFVDQVRLTISYLGIADAMD